jgi:molybdenum cofactor synthesis domain-containing protein
MIRVAVVTISDSVSQGLREDRGGPAVVERCGAQGWSVARTLVVPDEASLISQKLADLADSGAIDVLFSTGGTGITARDVTPEATRLVIEKEIVGIAELMRSVGLQTTPFSPLSRAVVGTRKRALIVNLPGSPKGAAQCVDAISHLVPHIVDLLQGKTDH